MSPLKILPVRCPSCSGQLMVKTMHCPDCGTTIDGGFEIPMLSRLDMKDQEFVLSFVKNSGSLKEMARELGFSYPTVRNMLDEIIQRIKSLETTDNNSNSQ